MNIQEPLKSGCFIQQESGEKLWVAFKFERLSDFCYGCGMIDHTVVACVGEVSGDMHAMRDERCWGPWMRALSKGPAGRSKPATSGASPATQQTTQPGSEEMVPRLRPADETGQKSDTDGVPEKTHSDLRHFPQKVNNPLQDITSQLNIHHICIP